MSRRVLIIESGAGKRRLDLSKSEPLALDTIDRDQRPVLTWALHALEQHGLSEPTYVGGYHIEKVVRQFPQLRFRYHEKRREEGELAAFLVGADVVDGADVLVIRAGTVLLPGALDAIHGSTVVAATYGPDASPVGIYRFAPEVSGRVLDEARGLVGRDIWADMDDLVARLDDSGVGVDYVSVGGRAAPVTDRPAVVATIFQGKAGTLDNLAPLARSAIVQDRVRFSLEEWRADEAMVLEALAGRFAGDHVIVRSSALAEDSLVSSGAGRFQSVLDVDPDDPVALRAAIEAVLGSYSSNGRVAEAEDEVLVQRQVSDLAMSGVLLTRDSETGAPYYVLSVDRVSGRSDGVTSGDVDEIDTCFVAWTGTDATTVPEDCRPVLETGKELMALSHLDALDIEFGVDHDGTCHLFQARPLVSVGGELALSDDDLLALLENSREFVQRRMERRSGLAGETTVLGTMPDWNPAEMIGTTPRPLALSLYQMLIGDTSWAEARSMIGYRDVVPEALVLSVGGVPYVDVRTSLNSLLPAALDPDVADRWVDACVGAIRRDPGLHDKIEFEVAATCMTPEWPEHVGRLRSAGLDEAQVEHFAACLRDLTNRVLNGQVAPIDRQLERLQQMGRRRERLSKGPVSDVVGRARLFRHLLEDCRRLGCVPFAVLARYAFIGMAMLKGLRRVGILDREGYDAFLRAVPTVASGFSAALAGYERGAVTLDELVEEYGHLRPNSYEITSPNYAADPERYFRPHGATAEAGDAADAISVIMDRERAVQAVLDEIGLATTPASLARFIVDGVAAREEGKFQFMKNLNAALEVAAEMGRDLDLTRAQVSFIPVPDLVRLDTDSMTQATRSHLRRGSEFHEKRWLLTRALRLPDLIREPDDVLAFEMEEWRANYITHEKVTARCVCLEEAGTPYDLEGAIVLIRAADPGFDWIFGHGIAGLITQYGGVASHMAIRAAEFGLPAAIGCGWATYERIRDAELIELDCGSRTMHRVR